MNSLGFYILPPVLPIMVFAGGILVCFVLCLLLIRRLSDRMYLKAPVSVLSIHLYPWPLKKNKRAYTFSDMNMTPVCGIVNTWLRGYMLRPDLGVVCAHTRLGNPVPIAAGQSITLISAQSDPIVITRLSSIDFKRERSRQ